MKFSSHGTYISPKSVVEIAVIASGLSLGHELPHAKTQHEQNQEARFEIIRLRGAQQSARKAPER